MNSASMPPTRKKNIAVVPYMIAIFLWSTVVNQLHDARRRRGRSRMLALDGLVDERAGVFDSGHVTCTPDATEGSVGGVAQQELGDLLGFGLRHAARR